MSLSWAFIPPCNLSFHTLYAQDIWFYAQHWISQRNEVHP